jgi:uncharacterized delta-60 repeat protein
MNSKSMKACLLYSLVSMIASLAWTVHAEPPRIQFQPRAESIILYQQAVFGVISDGAPPLAYQWRKNGVSIPGATADQIVLKRPRFSDAGSYSVVVSNAEGTVTSIDAELLIHPPRAGDPDFSFATGSSINGAIRSAALQPDGKLLIVGEFSTVHGGLRAGVARLNADGTTDHTFMDGQIGAGGMVNSVAVQADGKAVIGGEFSTVNQAPRRGVARLNRDGTTDYGFMDAASGVEGIVGAVAVQSDGKVLAGGTFSSANGMYLTNLARFNSDGKLDFEFRTPAVASRIDTPRDTSGINTILVYGVNTIHVQSDRRILIGGNFSSVNGQPYGGLARLNPDGTLDRTFQDSLQEFRGTPAQYTVSSLAIQADGKIVAVGSVLTVNRSFSFVLRLNSDGRRDPGFQNGISYGPLYGVAVQADGKVLVVGWRESACDVRSPFMTRLKSDGTSDSGFQSEFSAEGVLTADSPTALAGMVGPHCWYDGVGHGFYSLHRIANLVILPSGEFIAFGKFTTSGEAAPKHVARFHPDGRLDSGFANPSSGVDRSILDEYAAVEFAAVSCAAMRADGGVIIGGQFDLVDDIRRPGVAALNADGTLNNFFRDAATGPQNPGYNPQGAFSLALQTDGTVLLGGFFQVFDGETRNSVVRLLPNGALDRNFRSELSGSIIQAHTIAVQPDGSVLVGGYFDKRISGRNFVARLHPNGSLDDQFQGKTAGPNNAVYALALLHDGKILIGGEFSAVDGVRRGGIARLNQDGSLDQSFQNGLTGASSPIYPAGIVNAIALQADGKILIGGNFTTVNGVARNKIACLNPDGTLDIDFLAGLSGVSGDFFVSVSCIALQSDGRILLGGDFVEVNGVSRARLARLHSNGSLDRSFQEGMSGFDGPVGTLLVQPDGRIMVGGSFATINGILAPAFVRLWADSDVPPSISWIQRDANAVDLSWNAIPDRSYRVQYKESLSTSGWTDLQGDLIADEAGTVSKRDFTTGNPNQRFYRLRLLP